MARERRNLEMSGDRRHQCIFEDEKPNYLGLKSNGRRKMKSRDGWGSMRPMYSRR